MWVGLQYTLVETIVQYHNIQKWYMSFSLRNELDVLVDGIDVG